MVFLNGKITKGQQTVLVFKQRKLLFVIFTYLHRVKKNSDKKRDIGRGSRVTEPLLICLNVSYM